MLINIVYPKSDSAPFADKTSLSVLADSMMFGQLGDSVVQRFIALFESLSFESSYRLNTHDSAIGILKAFIFPESFNQILKLVSTSEKKKIFKRTILDYQRDADSVGVNRFFKEGGGSFEFNAQVVVKSFYGTQFQYISHTRWIKNKNWFIERQQMVGEGQQVRGVWGYLKQLYFFTLIYNPVTSHKTVRIVATWTQAGGKIPLVGSIETRYENIVEGIEKGHLDILDFLDRGSM